MRFSQHVTVKKKKKKRDISLLFISVTLSANLKLNVRSFCLCIYVFCVYVNARVLGKWINETCADWWQYVLPEAFLLYKGTPVVTAGYMLGFLPQRAGCLTVSWAQALIDTHIHKHRPHTHTYKHTHTHTNTYMHECTHECIHAHVGACTGVQVRMFIPLRALLPVQQANTHTHTHTNGWDGVGTEPFCDPHHGGWDKRGVM